MPRGGSRYATQSEPEQNLDHLTKNLAADLRKHVRRIDAVQIFTPEWVTMIDALAHVSNIAMMEHQLPRGADDSTLWEGDEMTVRFMLEEGKLNLCVRVMHGYFQACATVRAPSNARGYQSWLTSTASACGLADGSELLKKMQHFEQMLGELLRCALQHIESVQTCDLHELFEHCEGVLVAAQSAPPAEQSFAQAQNLMVLHYLRSVLSRLEQLDEDKVMGLVEKFALVPHVIRHLHVFHTALAELPVHDRLAGPTFLAYAFDSEAYQDAPERHLTTDCRPMLAEFKALFLGELVASSEQRKLLRPLLDVIERIR